MKTDEVKINYPADAYTFVREAVNFAVQNVGEVRHVSALELLENCKLYAQEQYGFLAGTVLRNWNIKSADDIGNIVFELIEIGKLSASPGDSREDFSVDFDLFDKNSFRIRRKIKTDKPFIVD